MDDSLTSRMKPAIAWAATLWVVYIFIWYLQYKFLGHPGSVDLFATLTDWLGFHGHEKAMRIGLFAEGHLATLRIEPAADSRSTG